MLYVQFKKSRQKFCYPVSLISKWAHPYRAYKLGKKRWSYNQVELKFHQVGGSQTLEVVEAMQYGTPTLSEEEKVRLICVMSFATCDQSIRLPKWVSLH